jgi:hypothetical protein
MDSQDSKCELDMDVQEGDKIGGVTAAHAMEYPGTRVGSRLCEYGLTFYEPGTKGKERETRGHREMRRSVGKYVPSTNNGTLHDEIIILAGADMSASDLVHTLRNFIKSIEERGLWIGTYKDKFIVEGIDRALTFG